jgi:hypothetical protein
MDNNDSDFISKWSQSGDEKDISESSDDLGQQWFSKRGGHISRKEVVLPLSFKNKWSQIWHYLSTQQKLEMPRGTQQLHQRWSLRQSLIIRSRVMTGSSWLVIWKRIKSLLQVFSLQLFHRLLQIPTEGEKTFPDNIRWPQWDPNQCWFWYVHPPPSLISYHAVTLILPKQENRVEK